LRRSDTQFDALLSAAILLWIGFADGKAIEWRISMNMHQACQEGRALNEQLVGLSKRKCLLRMSMLDHFKKNLTDTLWHDYCG